MSTKFKTLVDLFCAQKEQDGFINFIDVSTNEKSISFSDFWVSVLKCLGYFQSININPGDELVICTKSNEKFLIAFWAAILGGIVPVPLAVGISKDHRQKILTIADNLKSPKLITDQQIKERLGIFVDTENEFLHLRNFIDSAITDHSYDTDGILHEVKFDDIAFIQYSSGSTTAPKGIILTHENLTSNIFAIAEGLDLRSNDIGLSWMPLTHDMGLIGTHMTLFSRGLTHHVMDTDLFIRRPLIWLSKVNQYRASILTSPNFGYKHFLKAFQRKPIDDLDLSCVRLLINGAESISLSICNDFLSTLKKYQLSPSTMFPVYGLAEATLGVSFPKAGEHFQAVYLDRDHLNIGNECNETGPGENSIPFILHGKAIRDCSIRITDKHNKTLPNKYVGHIQIKGVNVSNGVYGDEIKTKQYLLEDGWLDTGDCGAIYNDGLVITGRIKEIIIVNGQNYYPHDIEEVIIRGGHFDLGKVVACGAMDENGLDQVLIFVLYKSDLQVFPKIAEQIRRIISQELAIEVDHILPTKKIPKTTSGKLQRTKLADWFLEGDFNEYVSQSQYTIIAKEKSESSSSPLDHLIAVTNEYSKDIVINLDDDLFEVGISSLTLTEIMMAIDEIYPNTVQIEDVFEHPTLSKLAKFITIKLNNSQ